MTSPTEKRISPEIRTGCVGVFTYCSQHIKGRIVSSYAWTARTTNAISGVAHGVAGKSGVSGAPEKRKLYMSQELRLEIRSAADIVSARQQGRVLAMQLGFGGSDLTVIATAISEVARSIVSHAAWGELTLSELRQGSKHGICVIAHDEGPSVAHLNGDSKKMNGDSQKSFPLPARRAADLPIPGVAWPMDKIEVSAQKGKGTTVTIKKWLH
jgi:serine/threonine-protein kinase RsbT